ncbi:MAG: 50S ribosomal protein L18 [Planctomycetes bacterium]|nr:50S ribosomal protein L18 [Planctomycetota bacterium]
MRTIKRIQKRRIRRTYRVRNRIRRAAKVAGTARPRLSVFRSNKHIYAQIIDDEAGHTLVAASTLEKAVCGPGENGGNKEAAAKVGKILAERALEKGIKQVAFDRGRYKFHGRVAALANAAREAGLDF